MEDYTLSSPYYSPLSLDSTYGALAGGYDFSPAQVGQPISNTAQNTNDATGGFQNILDNLTKLFDGGVQAYNNIAKNIGLPTANGTPTAPAVVAAQAAATPKFAGLTTSQIQLALVAIAGIALLIAYKKSR